VSFKKPQTKGTAILLQQRGCERSRKAVEMVDSENNNTRVGNIPRPFHLLFYRLLKKNIGVNATVYHLAKEDNRPHVIVFTKAIEKSIIENEADLQYLIEYHE